MFNLCYIAFNLNDKQKGTKMETSITEIEINGEKYIKKSDAKIMDLPKGDYVVIRTNSAGVHAGYLSSQVNDKVVLKNTRRLWYWEGAATLSQIAGTGISKPDSCKFPAAISEITLHGVIESIPCTESAKNIIEGIDEWKE